MSLQTIQAVLRDVAVLDAQIGVIMGGTVVLSCLLVFSAGCWGAVLIWGLFFIFITGSLFGIGFMSLQFYEEYVTA